MISLDVTDTVLNEAAAGNHGLVLSHHPLIFRPLSAVSDATVTGRLVQRASHEGLCIVSAHTNLDAACGGLADLLAEMIGLQSATPIEASPLGWSKLVTFVPVNDRDKVSAALFDAGAGEIGDYRHCSFTVSGQGTFLPLEGADPSIGEVGRDERVEELRLEMVFPSAAAAEIEAALVRAHSYEEPAYDIYPLSSKRHDAGSGRQGELENETSLGTLAAVIADGLGMATVRFTGGADRPVRRVAVVPGSGAEYIEACSSRADVLVSGDFKYHDLVLADELGLALVEAPHEVGEYWALSRWAPILGQALAAAGVSVVMASAPAGHWTLTGAAGNSVEGMRGGAENERWEDDTLHHLHVDGGSRGNPGPAGIGAVLMDSGGEVVATLSDCIGDATNNVAEYRALIAGIELALDRGVTRLSIFSDSELVVRQLGGSYKVRNEGLRSYYHQARSLLGRLDKYELDSVPREENEHADELVNKALDEAGY